MFHSISCFLCVCVEVVDGRTSSEFEVTSHMYRQIGMRSNNSEHLEVHPSSLCWAPSVFASVFFSQSSSGISQEILWIVYKQRSNCCRIFMTL
jgi:hypothetical protein